MSDQLIDTLIALRSASDERREALRRLRPRRKAHPTVIFNPAAHVHEDLMSDLHVHEVTSDVKKHGIDECLTGSPDSIMMLMPAHRKAASNHWHGSARITRGKTHQDVFMEEVSAELEQATQPKVARLTHAIKAPSVRIEPPSAYTPSPHHVGRSRVDHGWTLEAMVQMVERHEDDMRRRDPEGSHVLDCLEILENAMDQGDDDGLNEPLSSLLPILGIAHGRRLPRLPEALSPCDAS